MLHRTKNVAAAEITVRNLRFACSNRNRKWWLDNDPIATAVFNSLSLSFPRGEAYFIESVRAFRDGVPAPLAEEIRAFISQEVNHSREHLAFNRAMTDAGYRTDELDAIVRDVLDLARKRPPIVSLAATIALEHFTAMFAHELLSDPAILAGADPDLRTLWQWHSVEEIEHKSVAYDTWLFATREWPRGKRWKVKAIMMLLATRNFLRLRYQGAIELLRQDGITGWRAHWGVLRYALVSPGILRRVIPQWIAYFLPGFHPWKVDDRALIAAVALPESDQAATSSR